MDFSFLSFNHIAEKNVWDYIINVAGLILIPIALYFLSSVYAVAKRNRETQICALNSLTLYCKNFLQESLKLRNNEARRRNALQDYINNPLPENFTKAFYIVKTPSLQYELFANDYAFTANQYMSIVDLIFEVNSNIKTVTTAITQFNMFSEVAAKQPKEETVRMAKEMLLQLDSFHHNCCVLSYLINKLIYAVKIYNSYYFFQDIINLEFKGKMKEYLDILDKEMDDYYNPREHDWRNTFIENLENPPVKYKFKDIVKVFYLKFCGFVDKNKRILKQKIYLMKKTKNDLKNRAAKSACTEEKIQEIHEQYQNIINSYELCKEKYNSIETIGHTLNLQLFKGFIARLGQLKVAVDNIFRILPPERTLLLSADEFAQIELNLNFFTTNYIPCLNHIFKFMFLFCYPDKDIDGISFLSEELNEILDENYQNQLKNFYNSELYKFIEAYDYSISHGLPFELSFGQKDEKEELYVGIKIIPDDEAKKDGIKEVYIYDYVIKTMNLLLQVTNDVYETILRNSQIK